MNPVDWAIATEYADLVAIAESVDPADSYDAPVIAKIATAGYTFLHAIYGNELATDINPHMGQVVTFGFLALSPAKRLVAVIRGTDTIWEWLHDACFLMVPAAVNGVHGLTEDGFSAVYRSLSTSKVPGGLSVRDGIKGYVDSGVAVTVTVCGHSLGGALATLLGLDVAINTACRTPDVYTFASPRVGDHIFAGYYNAAVPTSYRISNRQDLVTKVPPEMPLPYEHVNTEFELNPPAGKIAPTIACMHHLTSYLWLMDQLTGSTKHSLDAACQAQASAGPG